jgi:hypothetical protein
MLMRGGEITRRNLKATMEYFSNHPDLLWVEQDALNLAFDPTHVEFLPNKFCIVSSEHSTAWNWGYSFHFAALENKVGIPMVKQAMERYQKDKNKWEETTRTIGV